MEKLKELIYNIVNIDFVNAAISNKRNKSVSIDKIKLRHIIVKGNHLIQATEYVNTKVIHKNMDFSEAAIYILNAMNNQFKQCQINTKSMIYNVLISKKGKSSIKSTANKNSENTDDYSHNKSKNYLLPEGEPVDFLVELGVMNKEGYVLKAKYDKFRQINRFLQFIDDIVPKLPSKQEVKIIDFGCGKSYLTFAIYYFLKVRKGLDVNITGLDLKEDVIKKCNTLAKKIAYEKLEFLNGNIADYTGTDNVDMVVTLHACDTATDYAIAKAVSWNAKVIMSVPCCQHEINKQINSNLLKPILKYGILKERMSALITDGIRAELLRENGYDVQVIEFIDMEHTPKNLLIRAVKKNLLIKTKQDTVQDEQYNLDEMLNEMNLNPTLKKLLAK